MHHLIQKSMITSLLVSICACSSIFDSDPTESTIRESYARGFEEHVLENSSYQTITVYGLRYEEFYCIDRNSKCSDQLMKVNKDDLQALAEQFDKKECIAYKWGGGHPDSAICLVSMKTPADLVKRYDGVPKYQYFKILLNPRDGGWNIGQIAKTDERTLSHNN